MDSYSSLLERTRVPQPSLQKLAVIAIFEKIRSESRSDSGMDAVTSCLHSASLPVVEQSVKEFCRLVKDSKFDLSTALLELQSALEGSRTPQFGSILIKAIGILVRLGFNEKPSSFRFYSSELHPFVKILSAGAQVQCELVKQIIVFIVRCKHLGMAAVCEFLAPFMNHSVIKLPISGSGSAFVKRLMSTILACCCSFPSQAIPLISMLTGLLKYFSLKNAEEAANISFVVECLVDGYVVVLRLLVEIKSFVQEAQFCGVELLEAILLLHRDFRLCSGGVEKLLDVSRQLLAIQKELSLCYLPEFSSVILSLFPILVQSELEYEQYWILKLILILLQWKCEKCKAENFILNVETLFIFPALSLVSSPTRCINQIATEVLSVLGSVASNLSISSKKKLVGEVKQQPLTTPAHLIFKFIMKFWSEDPSAPLGLSCVNIFSKSELNANDDRSSIKIWTSHVMEYCLSISKKQKLTTISTSEKHFLTEIPVMLCAVASVFLLHHDGRSSIDLMAVVCNVEPKLGVPLLLFVLFYVHMFYGTDKDIDFDDTLPKLLGLLSSLASHPAMTPMIVQILLPMLHHEVNPTIKATAIRLICKTWAINDRVFGSLQSVLHQNGLVQFASERGLCISFALSINDVCKENPDRGVDLILSVAACIENHDPLVQSLGFQSLAHLCEADVIDFYSAWDVIASNAQKYLENSLVAHGLSLLLRWGAMDAEAYPEASSNVLTILWDVGTFREGYPIYQWTRAREAAFTALLQYEVGHIQRGIPDFRSRNMELIIAQANPVLLTVIGKFENKVINFEHSTRQRFVNQRKMPGSKIFKMLDAVPEILLSRGSSQIAKELPGASLFLLPSHKDRNQKSPKGLRDVSTKYENAVLEIASSLQLSRNVLLALFTLQSWKAFMERWIRSSIVVLESQTNTTAPEKVLKAGSHILKVLTRTAESAKPQAAESIALAFGALCMVLPSSAHSVKSMASKFLLHWLCQYEHEHRQWSAAISLGLISSGLHVTDHKQKFEIINMLLEVMSVSRSTLVKGACGIGLGFSCQDLLTRVNSEYSIILGEKNTFKMQETKFLRKIISALALMITQISGSSAGLLEKLVTCFPLETDNSPSRDFDFQRVGVSHVDLDEDEWSAAGPVIGLGNALGALYRAGAIDLVIYLKDLIVSWLPCSDTLFSKSNLKKVRQHMLSLGACLALPSVVFFCQRVELINHMELNHLINTFMELISDLLSVDISNTFYQNLLMASCVGAGSLLAVILNSGLHSLNVDLVNGLLSLFEKTFSSPHPTMIHLGGMLGVINALGAGAGTLIQQNDLPSLQTLVDQKEISYVLGPLISNLALEPKLRSLIQEISFVKQNSNFHQLHHYAAWSVSYLRNYLLSEETLHEENGVHNDGNIPKPTSQGLAEDSLVSMLSLWLMKINFSELGIEVNVITVTGILRSLSNAPRLPSLDWEAVIRRCMIYADQVTERLPLNLLPERTLREECVTFSLYHASQFDSLTGFLDELSDLTRFKTLELSLQSLMLLHLGEFLNIFSNSRVVKLLVDLEDFLYWSVSSEQYTQAQKISFRVSCWKGLHIFLKDSAIDTREYAYNLEHFMEILFSMLPWSDSDDYRLYPSDSNMEWTEAIQCLGIARQSWLSNLLQLSEENYKEKNKTYFRSLKKIQAKSRLVRNGSLPSSELSKSRAFILDINSEVVWNILVEVVAALRQSDDSVRRQWLVDTAEILCVTSFPSTALQFFGLLCGSFCKYMLFLVADKSSVLNELPITLSSLLEETSWEPVAESVASFIWTSTERIYDWAKHLQHRSYISSSQPIDNSENDVADILLQVMHRTCISLKNYMPVEDRLKLANMSVP